MKEIQLTQGQKAIVDDDIYDKYNHRKFYAAKSKKFFYARNNDLGYLHNLVMGNKVAKNWQVKFINGNTLDCRKENLIWIRHSDNTQKESKLQNNRLKTSSYVGVSHVNYFMARIRFEGRTINIGKFDTEIEAAEAYNFKAKQLFGESAKLNTIL
jgi:hypothetical protein